jgi:hypothetical protein
MQEELGLPQSAPDTEEVTMDQELNGQPSAGSGDVAGGLSVYGDAEVKAAMAEEKKLAGEREAYYDKIAKALEEKRYGPSFSERMFQLSAAFAAPTSTRGFSGVMGNVMPVLAAQQKARREGEISRREALEQLEANRLTNKLGLARQDTQTKIALAKLGKQAPVRGVAVGDTLRNPYTNEVMGPEYNRVPMPDYYKALEAAPTPENLQAAVAYYPTFAVQLKAAYDRGLKSKGR